MFRDVLKLIVIALVPSLLGGVVHGFFVGLKLWFGFSLVIVVAMLWVYRHDLIEVVRGR